MLILAVGSYDEEDLRLLEQNEAEKLMKISTIIQKDDEIKQERVGVISYIDDKAVRTGTIK